MKNKGRLSVSIDTDCDRYLTTRIGLLDQQLELVNRVAATDELPAVLINDKGLKVSAHETVVPDTAQVSIDRTQAMLPHLKSLNCLSRSSNGLGSRDTSPT